MRRAESDLLALGYPAAAASAVFAAAAQSALPEPHALPPKGPWPRTPNRPPRSTKAPLQAGRITNKNIIIEGNHA